MDAGRQVAGRDGVGEDELKSGAKGLVTRSSGPIIVLAKRSGLVREQRGNGSRRDLANVGATKGLCFVRKVLAGFDVERVETRHLPQLA